MATPSIRQANDIDTSSRKRRSTGKDKLFMKRTSDSEEEDEEQEKQRNRLRKKRIRASKSDHLESRRMRHRGRSDTGNSASYREQDGHPSDLSRRIPAKALQDYVGKKALKKAMKVAKRLKTLTLSGYTNESNPFRDANLTENFVWRKKIEEDLRNGLDPLELSLKSKKGRQVERMAEIEKVMKRREERAIEKAQREEELAMLAKERGRVEFQEWEKKEQKFEQSKVRSEILLRQHVERLDDPKNHTSQGEEHDPVDGDSDKPDHCSPEVLTDICTEVNLESQVNWSHDEHCPRKPKYANSVHAQYEWNKYNQTHYDHDNAPPKIVIGYQFNIFYPDLADKIKAPTYHTETDGSTTGETCLIRFHAGPPYEDIAFRIVNKEWEYSKKKGFKCTFDGAILQVCFSFKKSRYRR